MSQAQQINLYQDEFRPRQIPLNARQSVLGLGLLLVVLSLASVFGQWREQGLETERTALRQQQAQLDAQLAGLRQQLTARQAQPALQRQVDELARELEGKQQVLSILAGRALGNSEGFAEHFTGLARQRLEGLWLTRLSIEQGGQRLNMQGTALKPEYVPRYLQRLAAEPVFAGTEFNSLVLASSDKQAGRIDFILSNSARESRP